ncbi:pentapeptide repeat-containing protein [Streptomyces scabiei]|jgi:uncharacterized protein YjbI with pentapeptide repeats|uniref:pentapeptide repeat-containing protein n=1 Tax=Streptomyces scabiei TaxID=1930 RepID=UPI000765CE7B|nr:pentapeptide repeat-containing protein [Streptomyces scabiei]
MHYLPHIALALAVLVLAGTLIWAYHDRAKPDPDNKAAVQNHARRHRTRLIASGTAGTVTLIILLVWAPWWVEGHRLKDDKLVTAAGVIITGFRTMLIALIVGALTIVGLYYTREKHRLEREQFQHAQDQFAENQKQFETTLRETQARDEKQADLTREGQVTGRYIEAIKLLASKERYEILGGIYALERIMKDSEKDRPTVIAVLAAYVRTRLDGTAPEIEAYVADEFDEHEIARTPLAEDIRAALTVLQSDWQQGRPRTDLRGIKLTGWDAPEVRLEGTCLIQAQLPGVCLPMANLSWAELVGANLRKAELEKATLSNAYLVEADLQGAQLSDANLRCAKMQMSSLKNAYLSKADLAGAVLHGADLEGADLTSVELAHANLTYARNLKVSQICMADIYETTKLPDWLAEHPDVRARIAKCEDAREARQPPPPADPTQFWARED